MRAEPRANVQCAKRVGAHAVRRPQMPDQERVRENGVFRYVAILTVLVATLAFVALDTFSVQRARLADFFSKPINPLLCRGFSFLKLIVIIRRGFTI